jgi:penicillin-insensitive murein endopeptidase
VLRKIFFLASLGTMAAGCASNPWSKITTPFEGPSEVIGQYSFGCLKGAQALATEGPGYQLMRLSRNRVYGHPALIQFIQQYGRKISKQGMGDILIGDMGQPRGGPFTTGHRSHQIGLDVDIWFWQPPAAIRGQHLSSEEREKISARTMISSRLEKVDRAVWNASRVKMLKIAAESPGVDRIFVNPVIKRELCIHHQGEEWLARIRPWWGHDDHFHVRILCPSEQPGCAGTQDPIPPGDSCDETLNWWFSDEAKELLKSQKGKTGPENYKTPDACQPLLEK